MTREQQIAELKAQLLDIEDSCAGWKSCKDGSYGLALVQCGWVKVNDKLQALQGTEDFDAMDDIC